MLAGHTNPISEVSKKDKRGGGLYRPWGHKEVPKGSPKRSPRSLNGALKLLFSELALRTKLEIKGPWCTILDHTRKFATLGSEEKHVRSNSGALET
jgi:hypothetical protein